MTEKLLMENNVRGIHLYPDFMEVLLLMFADDIACISDTISGLQKQLNILSIYCATYKLQVNIDKTKVLIFKKGGQLSRREKWYYNGHILETVNGFSYVGVHFTSNLSMYKMAESASIKAKRVLAYLLNSFNEFSYIPVKTFFKVFDAKVCSILFYGSEIWGLKPINCIEKLQTYACKRLLNVNDQCCNDAILGDLGRFLLHIYSVKRCLSYWIRILSLPETRYIKLCYNMLKYYDSIGHVNWVTDVRTVLYSNGYGYVWESQNVPNRNHFITNFVNRLKDQYIQIWKTNICNNPKLVFYKDFKQHFGMELYISKIDISKFRRALAVFRSSAHSLMVEKGRHYDIQETTDIVYIVKLSKKMNIILFYYAFCMRSFVWNIYQIFTYAIERMKVL